MSTYEALSFLGLDHYATAADIKAAYRRMAAALQLDANTDDPLRVHVAEERMYWLKTAYGALQHRVGHTAPDDEVLAGAETSASAEATTTRKALQAAGLRGVNAALQARAALLRVATSWRLGAEKRMSLRSAGASRAAAVVAVMVVVGYGIVHGAAAKHFSPTVVDAKTVSVELPVAAAPATATVREVVKAGPVVEKRPAAARTLRAPALPGIDPVEAKAIGSACLAETGEDADALRTCVLRTAKETPHAIHLE